MPDRKYDNSNDRRVTELDFKQRMIDLMANQQPLPTEGIYDEPVRYFKANEKWCAVIFGWLDWLEDIAGWADAENDNYRGIQEILIFEEGIREVILMTPEEFKEALCEGLNCWSETIAKKIISGTTSGIVIDDDGNVVVGGGDEPIEDDPETELNEEASSFDGACREIAQNIDGLFERLQALYLAGSTEANTYFIITNEYECEALLMEAAIAEFYTRKTGSLPTIISVNQEDLAEYMYCHGSTLQTVINGYILGAYATNDGTAQHGVNIVNALTDDQIGRWERIGLKVFSTQYYTYGCVPVSGETIVFSQANGDFAGAAYKIGAIANKINHRMLIKVSGKIVDTVVGGYQDFLYIVAADGTKTYVGLSGSLGTWQISSNWEKPTALEAPFRADGIYTFTRDTYENGQFLEIRRKMTNPTAGGQFTMEIDDLGES